MLDESMFDDIHEIAENSAYLKAVEEKEVSTDMYDQLPRFEDLKELEENLKMQQALTFDRIFHEPTGYYMIKCFLVADYAVDKAVFIKDVEAYRMMRFETARARIAKLIYLRFVAKESEGKILEYEEGQSAFEIMKNRPHNPMTEGKFPRLDDDNSFLDSTNDNNELVNDLSREGSQFQIGSNNNPIGVWGKAVKQVRERIERGESPCDLFDAVSHDVMNDLQLDMFGRFLKSEFYRKYIRTKWIETQRVQVKGFTTFRVLGRGGFGAVHACRKKDSGMIYAMKCINKKLVKAKKALDNVLEERNVLTMLKTNFVTNLKYALQDDENLYLIMDLMLGGDLKFHLINAGRFTEKRARFCASEVLLGLEHIHNASIIYRDMKLENILLDHEGHCKLSDLGLAFVTKVKIRGYAGTPGYTAPEMIRNKLYGIGADIFSYGVMTYRMLCGSKPFKGKIDRDLDKAVLERKPHFRKEMFSKEAVNLLSGLLQKRPSNRLGCGKRGVEEIKEHPFFESIDWGLLEAGYVEPPFIPNKFDVNAASMRDIGDFDQAKYRHVKLDDEFKNRFKDFEFISINALQDEMVTVLTEVDDGKNFKKFATAPDTLEQEKKGPGPLCCRIL